ncbi:unnamed protein product [Prunus armeniaca]
MQDENMELKRQKVGSSENYAWTDYLSLPFTQNVISETLRMANIINAIWRKALKDVEIKGRSSALAPHLPLWPSKPCSHGFHILYPSSSPRLNFTFPK